MKTHFFPSAPGSARGVRFALLAAALVSLVLAGESRAGLSAAEARQVKSRDPVQSLLAAVQSQTDPGVLALHVQRWARTDLPSALTWVATFPAGDARNAMVSGICLSWCEKFPKEAALFAVEQIPAGPARDAVLVAIAHQWGERNLAEAQEWVSRNGSPGNDRAIGNLVGGSQAPRLARPVFRN